MADDQGGRREAERVALWTGLALSVISTVAVAAGLIWGVTGRHYPPGIAVLIGLAVGLVMGGIATVARMGALRRGLVPVVPGADAQTRKAVLRALRDGHADDPRIDALARDFVARSHRMRWLPYLYLALLALSTVRLVFDSHEIGDIVLQSSSGLVWLMCAIITWRHQHHLATYGSR